MSYQFLKVKNEDGIAFITLNQPPLNVLTIAMMEEIIKAFPFYRHNTARTTTDNQQLLNNRR